MYTITITETGRGRVVDSGDEFIDVTAEIKLDGQAVAERRLGFPLDATEDAIKAELQAVLSAFVLDQNIATQTQRSEELNTHADEVQANLAGMTIEHESNPQPAE